MNIDQQITVKRMSQLKLYSSNLLIIMWSVFSNVKHKLRIFSHVQYLYKHTHTEESLTYL